MSEEHDSMAPLLSEGQLSERALTDVLLDLSRHGATGILTIQGETDILAISLLEGRLVSTDSLNRTLEEGLAEILEKEGWVTAEGYASLASEYRAGGGRVVDLLVERDYITERQLGVALRQHIYRLGLDAFRWQGGEFKFYAGDEVSYESCVKPIGIEEFVVRATRDLGSIGPLDGGVGTRATPYRHAPDLPPMRDANTLTPAERWLMHELAKPTTVGALVDRGEYDEFQVVFYLWRLERRGLLQRGQDVGSVATPAPVESAPSPEPVVLAPVPAPEPASDHVLSELSPLEELPPVDAPYPAAESFDSSLEMPLEEEFGSPPEVIELPRLGEPEAEVISLGPVGGALEGGESLEPSALSPGDPRPVEMPEPATEHLGGTSDDWGGYDEAGETVSGRTFDLATVVPWVSRSVATLGGLLLAVSLFYGGDRAIFPYPWHSGQRDNLARQREDAKLARLDEAFKTFFLLNGRFPDDLDSIRADGWVRRSDLLDADRERYSFSPTTSTYVLQSPPTGSAAGERLRTGTITGNFLLDPDLAAFSDPDEVALVLLD